MLTFRLYYIRLITFALLPLIIEMFCWLFWAVYGRCKKMKKKDRWDRSNATSIIILFLFYSTIVSELAKSLSCKEIEGVNRLYEDLEEKCYEGSHLLMILTVSVPGLIVWAIGIPVFALCKILRNIEKLRYIRKMKIALRSEAVIMKHKVRLGFLTSGFDNRYYYWEIVLLFRKTLIVLLIVFLN